MSDDLSVKIMCQMEPFLVNAPTLQPPENSRNSLALSRPQWLQNGSIGFKERSQTYPISSNERLGTYLISKLQDATLIGGRHLKERGAYFKARGIIYTKFLDPSNKQLPLCCITLNIPQLVGNKAKERISKRGFQENKARQIFRKTNISYPLIRTFFALF